MRRCRRTRLPPPESRGVALRGRDLTSALTARGAAPRRATAASASASARSLLTLPAAFGQITRCNNCSAAYNGTYPGYDICSYDAAADAARFTVPCCTMPRRSYDWMGVSVRVADWRLTRWCRWDGARLAVRWDACDDSREELFDHRSDVALFDPDAVDNRNVVRVPALRAVRDALRLRLRRTFVGA